MVCRRPARDDPRYDYALDIDGEIRGRNVPQNTYLKAISIGFNPDPDNDEIVIGVPLRYLHDLTAEEQAYWKSFEHESQDFLLHPDWVRPHLLAEFPEKISPYTAILREMELVNAICDVISYPHLYRSIYTGEDRPTDYGYVIRPTGRELSNFYEQLNKLLIDNMRHAYFERARVQTTEERQDGHGNTYQGQRGTIAMLEDFLKGVVRHDPEGMVPSAMATLRSIRKHRSSVAHDIKENDYDPAVWSKQRALVMESYYAVRTVRQLLQSHPKAAEVDVPEVLDQTKVWTF